MADTRENIILQVGLDGGKVAKDLADISRQLANVKRNQQDLNEQYKNGEITLSQYTAQTTALKDEQSWLQKEQKGLIATQKLLTETTDTYSDSLNGERQKLADMQKAYDQLDKSYRDSAGGKEFLKQIQEQDKKVKEMEESTGRAQRNVGAYADAMQKAGVGISGFTTKLKAMLANPLVAFFAAAVAVVQKLRDAFKRNDDAGTRLQKAFAAFKPILTLINQAFSKLADVVSRVAERISKFANFFARLIPGYRESAAAAQELVEAQDRLQEQERQFMVQSAARQKQVAKLNDEIAQSVDGYSKVTRSVWKVSNDIDKIWRQSGKTTDKVYQYAFEKFKGVGGDLQKLSSVELGLLSNIGIIQQKEEEQMIKTTDLIDEAIKIEEKELQERVDIAKKSRDIQYQKMLEANDFSDKAKDELAKLDADIIKAETEFYTGTRRLQKMRTSQEEKDRKEREEQEKKAAAARLEIERATEDKLLSLETDGTKKQIEQARIAGQREVENLRKKLDDLKKEDLEARAELQKLIDATERATQKQIDEIQIRAAKEREDTILATKREAAKRGVTDAIELAQMQVDATQEDYARMQQMTDQQVLTLYGTWENYYQQLAAAETAAYDAREALAVEQYERERQRSETAYKQRLIGIDNEYALAEIELQQKQAEYDALLSMDDETKARLYKNEDDYRAAVVDAESEIANSTTKAVKMRMQSLGALGDMMTEVAGALENFSSESEDAAKAQKAFAFTGILLNQAQSISEGALAIAKGVESAAGIPFPANIPAIISITAQVGAMIAGVMSSIAQAKQIFAQSDAGKFEHGGTIDGTSYTGDKLIAHVNSGEGIYTGKQANNLLQEIANNPLRGGADMDAMTAAFTAAVAALPAPKMVYSEFNDFTQEVATYNELAAI